MRASAASCCGCSTSRRSTRTAATASTATADRMHLAQNAFEIARRLTRYRRRLCLRCRRRRRRWRSCCRGTFCGRRRSRRMRGGTQAARRTTRRWLFLAFRWRATTLFRSSRRCRCRRCCCSCCTRSLNKTTILYLIIIWIIEKYFKNHLDLKNVCKKYKFMIIFF